MPWEEILTFFFRDKFRMSCKTRNGDGDAFLHFRKKIPQTGEWISGAEGVMICFGNHHFHIVAVFLNMCCISHLMKGHPHSFFGYVTEKSIFK